MEECIESAVACRWLITGRVQGVGFRPFAYRLARDLGVRGFAQNLRGQVMIVGEGAPHALRQFEGALVSQAPPLARPSIAWRSEEVPAGWLDFRILDSDSGEGGEVHLPPDCFCCDDCLRELNDPRDRRYAYPFINCTQCGPRYTLICRLPYDRANTTMAGFAMCAQCRAEYENPGNRRFHAEPIACPSCGPRLFFHGADCLLRDASALVACVEQLKAGAIAAVKGIGGYHLMADATNAEAVASLRERKQRPHKPMAVMFPIDDGGAMLQRSVILDQITRDALSDPARPIVLCRVRPGSCLAPGISPGLNEVGVMLPYSPLHHLLLQSCGRPLIATSANISGEPVLTESAEVEARLADVADCCLHHDRPIARPADDSVLRVIAGRARPIRLGRGMAPIEMTLPVPLRSPLLAVGSQMKNTVALGWGERAVISPHLGDLYSPRTLAVFEQTIADMREMYGVMPEAVACDAHPGFAATRWARASGLPLVSVLHHHAHASALAAETPEAEAWLIFTWDGIGLGDDGTLWGGEGFAGRPGAWQRVATLRPFRLPAADKAARSPWRSAAALCWETGHPWRCGQEDALQHAWRRGINCRWTSAAGRLFDAAAALIGVLDEASFEGQGPMWLEALAEAGHANPVPLPVARDATGLWEMDWRLLVEPLADTSIPAQARAAMFHASLAQGLLAQARAVRSEFAFSHVGLCGGVFQNRLLTEQAVALLREDGFEVRLAGRLPCNDAALAFGQLVEAGARQ